MGTLYQTHVKGTDDYGNTFTYTKGSLTSSRTTAVNRLKNNRLKGYVQDINSKKVIFQNMRNDLQAVGL